MGRTRTVDEAREVLRDQPGLYAIIVTPSHGAEAQPVGIVTAWDVLDS